MKKYLSYILLFIGIAGFLYFQNDQIDEQKIKEPLNINYVETTSSQKLSKYVEIRGEVRFPGVYEYQDGEIIKQIIDKAGGLTEKADITNINQAELIISNALIDIPKIVEDSFVSTEDRSSFYVDIKGEVKSPGVYFVVNGLRVFELIELAGGLTENANVLDINMSEKITDGMQIIVPAVNEKEKILVYIGGEIKNPGYYEMDETANLLELVQTSGGFTSNADVNSVDFSIKLYDGQMINIPQISVKNMIYVSIQGEVVDPDVYYVEEDITVLELINIAGGLTKEANADLIDFDQILVLGSVVRIPNISSNNETEIKDESGLININSADLEALSTLNGIGHILAQRIIDYRSEYGSFQSIEDIQLVSGIKASIYEKIKEYITV